MTWHRLKQMEPKKYYDVHEPDEIDGIIDQFNADNPPDHLTQKRIDARTKRENPGSNSQPNTELW